MLPSIDTNNIFYKFIQFSKELHPYTLQTSHCDESQIHVHTQFAITTSSRLQSPGGLHVQMHCEISRVGLGGECGGGGGGGECGGGDAITTGGGGGGECGGGDAITTGGGGGDAITTGGGGGGECGGGGGDAITTGGG
jgi:hypothetical protein